MRRANEAYFQSLFDYFAQQNFILRLACANFHTQTLSELWQQPINNSTAYWSYECFCLIEIGNAKTDSSSYNLNMTRLAAIIVLILSILMPLQVAAEVLLSVSPCLEEMTVAKKDTDSGKSMPCCPDEDIIKDTSICKTAKTCHLCKTPGQVHLSVSSIFRSLANLSLSPKPPETRLSALNPANIWRPPAFPDRH